MEIRSSDRQDGPCLLNIRTVLTSLFAVGACIGLSYLAYQLTDVSAAELLRSLVELADL